MKKALLLLVAVVLPSLCSIDFAEGRELISFDALIEECSKNTLVYTKGSDGALFVSGEKMNGFCLGFLEGVFLAMQQDKAICVQETSNIIDPHYLLSVVSTYRKGVTERDSDAISVVSGAFHNIFSCVK